MEPAAFGGGSTAIIEKVNGAVRRNSLNVILTITLIILPSCSRLSSDKVDRIIGKHIKALGGEEVIRSIHSVISTSEIEIMGMGMKGSMKSYSVKPCLSHSVISLGFFNIRQGYDGDRLWRIDPNGKLQFRRDPGSLESQVTICIIESHGYLFPGQDFTLKALESDTVEGIPCEVIELQPEGGCRCVMHFDSSTFLLKQLELETTEGTLKQQFDDYRSVEGMMFPFLTRTHHVALNQKVELRTQAIDVNSHIDPLIFLPPPGDVRDYRFTEGHSSTDIPFKYIQRHIYIPARIGDMEREFLFLLDSGAGMTVIDSILASEMELPLGGKIPGAGAGGMADFHMTRIPGLKIRGIGFSDQTVISYPISRLTRHFSGVEVGGVIGYDFLSRFVTRIDYEKHTISFFEPDSFKPTGPATVLDAPLLHNVFSSEVLIDEKHGGTFLLDTGANSSVLQRNFVEENELMRNRKVLNIVIQGAGGAEEAALSRFDALSIGGVHIKRPVLALSLSERGIGAFEGMDGIIGNDILERFILTLDYGKQRVLLEKNSRFDMPFFQDRSGLQIARGAEGGLFVFLDIPGSPADKAGVRKGDEILRIDGRDISSFDSLDDILLLFQAEEGTRLEMKLLRKGKEIRATIILKTYI